MSRFRMYPTSTQAERMLTHCAHARYVWNLAVEQHSHWRRWRKSAPGFAEQCRQLTQARRANGWLGAGNADVQQQALKDFVKAKNARFTSGFGESTWREKFRHEGFRVIGTDRVPEYNEDGSPKLNAKGKQVSAGGGFHPPDEVIERETSRNRDALLENADCVSRSIWKEAQYCS